jgi:serine phosphatase RsbU (regulator of sigma subunit)
VHAGILDVRGNHGQIIGIERNQFELRRHRSHP